MLSDKSKDKDIEEAVAKLVELRENDVVRRIADSRAKYLSDYTSNMEASYEKGYKEGLRLGYEESFEKGKLIAKIARIESFLEKGITIETIADLFELSITEVKNIIDEHIKTKG